MTSFGRDLELVLSLVRRDLKVRYKESVLGFFWSLLRPAFLTLILWLVFSVVIRIPMQAGSVPYWIHALISVLTWNFFFGSITDATHSVVANGNLLKKVPLDARIFPVAAVISQGVHFLLALTVSLLLAPLAGIRYTPWLLLLPLVVILTSLLALGFGLLLSGLNVYYRDTGSAVELLGMAWFYATPVIYPATMAMANLGNGPAGPIKFGCYISNPAAPLLILMRRVTLHGSGFREIPDSWLLAATGGSIAFSVALLTAGSLFFRKRGGEFADEL